MSRAGAGRTGSRWLGLGSLIVVLALVAGIAADARLAQQRTGGAHSATAPAQRWGSAAGQEHLKPGAVNRTLPESERGRYPRVPGAVQPANVASAGTGATTARTGFDRATSKEILGARDANRTVFANTDGTETTEVSPAPVNYRAADGSWQPIDTTLSASGGDGWRNTSNSVALGFAQHADAAELASIQVDDRHSVGYGLAGAAPAIGTAEGESVRYPAVLPSVDLRLDARPGGVKETLVLKNANAPQSFVFPLRLNGLSASLDSGRLAFTDTAGTVRAVVPPGDMTDAAATRSTGVTYQLIASAGGPALRMTLDPAWLRDPARRFPVEVDPTITPPVDANAADGAMYVHGTTSTSGASELQAGVVGGASTASYLAFGGLVSSLRYHKIFGAQLQLVNYDAGSCQARPLSVHPVTQAWTPTGAYSYPGPSVGPALATRSFAHGYVATGQSTSACPPAAELFDLGGGGVDLVQGWVNGTTPNNGLSLRAPVSDPLAGKRFTGPGTTNPPRLYITHSPYDAAYAFPNPTPDPPVLQNQDGHVKITVTNRSAQAWTPGSYSLGYRVYTPTTSAPVAQQRAAALTTTVARGGTVTFDATIKALPPGSYFLDFSMIGPGNVFFTDHLVLPARLSLRVVDIPPVVQELYPPNGYHTPTLTPSLWGRAVDLDAPPGSSLSYKFEVCERTDAGAATGCFDSGYLPGQAWTVPAGKLSWSKAYLWRVFVKDGGNEVASPRSTVLADVPQPELTSSIAGAARAAQDHEFDAQSGNLSTTAVDATLATAGPELSLVRTYNSLDPRRDGLFGEGWTTRYDMRLVTDDDGSGNVVITYPDGQAVRFGRNPDGSYATTAQRTAGLTAVAGGWRLADRAGVVYLFSTSGRLTKVTDAAQRSMVLTYNSTDGRLAQAQVSNSQTNTAGRRLRFTWSGAHVATVTDDLNTTWTYGYTGDALTSVCTTGNGCTRYTYSTGSHYRGAVLDDRPESYWRLGEVQGGAAGSEIAVNLGKDAGTYTAVTLGTPGATAGSGGTAATFNGTSSRLDLPKGTVKKSRDGAVELWFKANPTGTGGPLLGYQDKAFGTAAGRGVPVLYVGTDGRLRGQFGATAIAPITSAATVNDGRWHHVVLSAMGTGETLYLDGVQAGQATGVTIDHALLTFNQVGAASVTTPASWPAWGTAAQRFFTGTIDELAVYAHPLGAAAVSAHFRYGSTAADQLATVTMPSGAPGSRATYDTGLDRVATYTDRDGGTWKIGAPAVYGDDTDLRRSVQVLDPANRANLYEYDALTGLMLRSGVPLGLELRDEDRPGAPVPPPPPPVEQCSKPDPGDPQFCTIIPGDAGGPVFVQHPLDGMAIRTYSYDDRGDLTVATNENGDAVTMAYDGRGNVVSTKTCRQAGQCQTTYSSFPATAPNPFDPRNELPTESRDGRSADAADPTYRTSFTYTAYGDPATETAPDGGVIRHTYTNGAEPAAGGGIVPPGLPLTTTDARGKVTTYSYFANGDLSRISEPSGLVTSYTYDALGRQVTETEISDAYPAGVTTTTAYDPLSRPVSVTEPATTDAVGGGRHQHRTTTVYDADGNAIREDEADLLGADPVRTTLTDYDESGRPVRVTDPEGHETTSGYDRSGNLTSTVDPNGNRYDFAYTARNMLAEVRLRAYTSDAAGGLTGDYLVLHSYSYDFAGRPASDTDAMGRRVEYSYDGADGLRRKVLKNFHDPDSTTRDYVLEDNTYDGAGNRTKQVTGNGTRTVTQSFDRVGNVTGTVADPAGLARATAFSYDAGGNVTRVSRTGKASNVPWAGSSDAEVVDYGYDDSGNVVRQAVSTGTDTLVTTSAYDRRGLLVARTEPRGNVAGADPAAYTTNYSYDELGRQVTATGAPIAAESGGAAPQTVRPVTKDGYDAFGERIALQDEAGDISRWDYDRAGRAVSASEPSYRPPGATAAFTPTTRTRYDALGNTLEVTDPLGNAIRYGYDQLNRLVTLDAPATTNDVRAVSHYTYTRTGQRLSTTDPLGGRTEATYDDLDRPVTATQIERYPVADAFTAHTVYDDPGDVTASATPSGATTRNTFDALGQLTRSADPNGVVTQSGYDKAGRVARQSDAAGRTVQTGYDGAGRAVAKADLRADGTAVRTSRQAYDAAGNPTSATDALGVTTTFAYDAGGRLVRQTEPVAAGSAITTSFGYDAAGRRTRYTDGAGHDTVFTYNTLGLPESLIEPATAAYPAANDRTWTAGYDAATNLVRTVAPGGVVTNSTYDAAGRLTQQSGAGGTAQAATRTRDYDLLDRIVRVGAPGGSDTYSYDDRGQVLTARGPSGSADYVYDGDGDLTARTDAAGTARFGYLNGRLTTAADGLTGTTEQFGYDPTGRLASTGFGAGRVRSYGYDELGRTASDTVRNGTGQPVASIAYTHDADDRLTGKTTTGTAGAGANSYGYDSAGRLTSWTGPAGTTGYGWDAAGNRTTAGATAATYDARNQLLSDGDHTYSHTARGTLAAKSGGGTDVQYTFDAFDRMVAAGGQSYAYDDLDRPMSNGGTDFAYAGTAADPVSAGDTRYARGPDGDLLASATGDSARVTLADEHDDVVGDFAAGDTALTGLADSTAYDPFGQVVAEQGDTGDLGFQGDWTDPVTGDVDLGARWYDPETGTFDSRDQANYSTGDSVLANRYAYGAADPLDFTDPDGNFPFKCGFCHTVWNAAKSVYNSGKSFVSTGASKVSDAARWFGGKVVQAAKAVASFARNPGKHIKAGLTKLGNGIKHLADKVRNSDFGRAAGNAWHQATHGHVAAALDTVSKAAKEKARKVAKHLADLKITKDAKAALARVVKTTAIPALIAAAKPVVHALGRQLAPAASLAAKLVPVLRDSVADSVKSATALYHQATDLRGPIVEGLSKAGQAVAEFGQDPNGQIQAGLKAAGNKVLDDPSCSNGFNCAWNLGWAAAVDVVPGGAVVQGAVNAAGVNTTPDYVTVDASAIPSVLRPGPAVSLTVTSSGQISWAPGGATGTPGAGAGLRAGWLVKRPGAEAVNSFATGPAASLGGSVPIYRGLGPSAAITRSSGYTAIEAGISFSGSNSKDPSLSIVGSYGIKIRSASPPR